MAGTAEQLEHIEHPLPLVLVVPEMEEDQLLRHRAERFIRFAGSQALHESAERPEDSRKSLMDAIHQAAAGDLSARRMIEMNAKTDVVERTIKAGHVMHVELEVDDEGKLLQHGQTMESVHANSLRFTIDSKMRPRTEAETRNAFRIEQLHRLGLLKDYNFVVFSRIADNMTSDELSEAGFFEDTMSCAIQLTTETDGKPTAESAFVAGVAAKGEAPHDTHAVELVASEFDVDYHGKSAAEIIDTPLLIHKSLMPNGVVDLVARYDQAVGDTFFGEAKPMQDYVEYASICEKREVKFAPKVRSIVEQLISEYADIRTPLMATKRLHEISEEQMLEHAFVDKSIDPMVFGVVSAGHIELARLYMEQGDTAEFKTEVVRAKQTAKSSSCPTGSSKASFDSENSDNQNESSSSGNKKEKMKCPFCKDKNQYGDPCSPNQHCTNCDARVSGGKVVNKGNGGKKAQTQPKSKNPETQPQLVEVINLEQKRRAAAAQMQLSKLPLAA